MNKTVSVILLFVFALSLSALGRVQYDSTGRYIVKDNTIRGQRRADEAKVHQQRKIQAAAAAKIDYEKALRDLEAKPYTVDGKAQYYQTK